MNVLVKKVHAVEYHRNGITGKAFHVVLFDHQEDNSKVCRMVGIIFEGSSPVSPQCAVLDVDKLAEGNISFGSNSWRGDWFYNELVEAIGLCPSCQGNGNIETNDGEQEPCSDCGGSGQRIERA